MATCNWIITIVLFAFGASVIFSVPCAENIQCPKFNSCDLVIPQATKWGCCDVCIQFLKKDAPCVPFSGQADLGLPADKIRRHCGPRLQCNNQNQVCNPSNTKCVNELEVYHSNKQELGWLQIGKVEPRCDDYGDYESYQCLPGSMCYCVGKEGERIFGEFTREEVENQHCCRCSRAIKELENLVRGTSLGTWAETDWKKLKHFLRCSANGDYESLQCIDGKCFCMNNTLQQEGIEERPIKTFRLLHCYNPNIHSEEYIRPCEKQLMLKLEQLESIEARGQISVGIDLPVCDLDGSYAPKQCANDTCHCVDKDGDTIKPYVVQRYTSEAEDMTCKCAREEQFLATNRLTKTLQCKQNGNYENKQCLGSLCYCVNKCGDQIKEEFSRLENSEDCEITGNEAC